MASRSRRSSTARRGGISAVRPALSERVGTDQLANLQRARMVNAMVEVAWERGAANTSVAHVVKRAGVSRRTFYEMFAGCEDCFAAAFEQVLAFATGRVAAAYDPGAEWRERIRGGLVALLSFLDEEPTQGKLLIVESLSGGPAALERREEVVLALMAVIDQGRARGKASAASSLAAEGVVGGVLGVIHSRLLRQDCESLVELVNPLMSMIVLPYLGPEAANRELRRAKVKAPERKPPVELSRSDPFKDAGMRLTYRTVRVLAAAAERPGASNRAIGDAADIRDQGQVSKLLTRLQRAGMIDNTGGGAAQGAPNAWVLTASGLEVVTTIRARTEGVPEGGAGGA
jgi:AcrR family transcriptional regulator